ncbi:hypothetical protein Bbelb_163790 [Branchiostoma belcheri]|nr:hypothetical protein Bbelb_163790 [Branchiostoma belcheri]
MAGHGVVLVALTLATWSLCLLHSTGQEVSPGSSVEEIVAKCSGRIHQSLCDPQGVLTAEEELEIRRSLAGPYSSGVSPPESLWNDIIANVSGQRGMMKRTPGDKGGTA